MEITIDFDNGLVCQDNKVIDTLTELYEKGEDFSIGSVILLDGIRVLMGRGVIEKYNVSLNYGDIVDIKVNDRIQLEYYPNNIVDNFLSELLWGAI